MKLTSPRYVVGAFIAGVIAFGGVGLANAQSSDTTTDSGVDSTVESIDEPATDATSDDAITDATTDDATTDDATTDDGDRPAGCDDDAASDTTGAATVDV